MPIRLLQDMECSGKTVVIRQDLNVPMKDGRITNDKRIRAALPGIRMALDKGAGVVLLSHLGRPTEGVVEEKFSLAPVAAHLSGLLGRPVKLAADFDAAKAAPGEVVLLENIRFFKGEKKNDPELAAKLAALGDIYVMDAFGAAPTPPPKGPCAPPRWPAPGRSWPPSWTPSPRCWTLPPVR